MVECEKINEKQKRLSSSSPAQKNRREASKMYDLKKPCSFGAGVT